MFNRHSRLMRNGFLPGATMALLLLTAIPARALEVRIGFNGCFPGGGCGWSMQIGPSREARVEVVPQGHLSRRFSLSQAQFVALRTLLEREGFFSLPTKVGVLVPDGSFVEIQIVDGSKRHTVRLTQLPHDLRPIWKTDVGSVGRAYRVCEELRSLTGVASAQHCPGVPESAGGEK